MTLNDLERRNGSYLAFFPPNSIALLANYVTLWLKVEKLTHPAARSLCYSWATCLYLIANQPCADSSVICYPTNEDNNLITGFKLFEQW